MMRFKIVSFFFLLSFFSYSQTKVAGIVLDTKKQPIPFANVAFKGGEGVQTDENGVFVLKSSKI